MTSQNISENEIQQKPQNTDNNYETLTQSYERLRHSEDVEMLSEFARRPLPDRSDQAAFSRATALLEAVSGNEHTPVKDRVFLASTMPFPNVLVKLSTDRDVQVRCAVASNENSKNWLVGRLTKDSEEAVRDAALRNPQTSWKMRLEGAQSESTGEKTLDFLAGLGVGDDKPQIQVLSAMVRRAVALNPNTSHATLENLSKDVNEDVSRAANERLHE